MQRRLPRGILSEARLDNAAHDNFVNIFGPDARAPDAFAHNHCAEFGRFEILQSALKLAGRRPHGADNHSFFSLCHNSHPRKT
jgi:hypothetical protein